MRDTFSVLNNIASSTGWTPSTGALDGSIVTTIWEPYRDSGGTDTVVLSYDLVNQGTPILKVEGRVHSNDSWKTLVEFNPLTFATPQPSGVVSEIVATPQLRVTVTGTGAAINSVYLAE